VDRFSAMRSPERVRSDRVFFESVSQEAFSPDDITGLVVWLKADAIEGLNDDDLFQTWPDSSGNGHDAVTQGEFEFAQYKTNIISGLPVVRLGHVDGGCSLVVGSLPAGFLRTMFFVARKRTPTQGGGGNSIFITTSPSGGVEIFVHDQDDDAHWRIAYDDAFFDWWGEVGDATAWTILAVRYDSVSSATAWADGSSTATGDPEDSFPSLTQFYFYNVSLTIGDWDIAETLVYDSALSDADLNNVGSYLATKYALTWEPVS
jgi:hypothetical protein